MRPNPHGGASANTLPNTFPIQASFDFATLWRLVRENALGIIILASLVAALTALVVHRMPSEYTARTTILVEPDKEDQVGLDAVFSSGLLNKEYLETQRYIFYSRSLAAEVVERTELYNFTEYQRPRTLRWWQGDLRRHLPGIENGGAVFIEDSEADKKYAVSKLLGGVQAVVVPRTQMIKVSVTSENSQLAALVANQMVQTYIESGLEARLSKTKNANAWLGGRLETMKQDLALSEQKLQEFLAANKLVSVGGVRSLVEKDITQNTANLLDARKTVAELNAVVKKIRNASGDWERLAQIQSVASNALVQSTRAEFLNAKEKLAAVASRYGPKHPKRINAEAIHKESKSSYVAQITSAANNIQSNYDLATQRVRDLGKFTNENRAELQQLDRKSYQLKVLEREVDANRKLYDLFLSKLKETDLSDDFQTVNAIVVDEAQAPNTPASPRRKLIIAVSFLLTVAVLFGLVILRWVLNKTIRDPDQLGEKLPGSILLGVVPKERVIAKRSNEKTLKTAFEKSPKFTEAVQGLRTSLFLSEPDKPNQVVMIASALPAEGKSTLSMALAVSLSRVAKTLVIEADLRRPKFASLFGSPDENKGLAQLLVNSCELEEAVQHSDWGVDYITAGTVPPNPLELLGSERFKALLVDLRGKYDRIVIDCPPVEPVSDTLLIASQADALVYVLRADSTTSVVASKAISSLQEAGARVVGIALNDVDTEKLSKYYGGRYSGYGATGYFRSFGAAE